MTEYPTLNLNEPVIDKVKIIKVGFVSTLPDGHAVVHDWGFTGAATEENYTVGQLQKISEDFYGDMLETYQGRTRILGEIPQR